MTTLGEGFVKPDFLQHRASVSLARVVAAVALALGAAPPPRPAARPPIPVAPRTVRGFEPGEDRRLASGASVVEYFTRLDATSDRVRVEEIGKTTLGHPLVLATISSPK